MDLSSKEISFSKYVIFYVLTIFVLSFSVIPKIWYSITYKRTIGIIQYFEPTTVFTIFGEEIKQHPRVDFAINNKTYSFYGNNYLRDGLYGGDTIKVIYDPESPQKAYISSFIGIWAPQLANVFPILVISFLVIGLDYIPKRITIKF